MTLCPTFDCTCPYCLASGECIIDDPINECDDYATTMELLPFKFKEVDEDDYLS